MKESSFFIDEESYLRNYKPVFHECYKFKHAVQFLITLPYQLPFPNNSIVSFQDEENYVLSYNFLHVEKEKKYSAGADDDGVTIEYYETRVEMTYFTNKIYYFFSEDELSDIFNDLIKGLNYFITTFLIKNKDLDIHKISKEMLEPFCLNRVIKIEDDVFKEEKEGVFILHLNVAHKKDIIPIDKQNEIVNYLNVIKNNVNPFVLSEDLMLSARRNFNRGFYKESILDAQSSIETFLRTLFSECLNIEGSTEEEISSIQEATSYITMVKREFSKRIGGTWDITNERQEVGNWYKRCYEIRNKIIHAGYSPSFSEVDNGLAAAKKLQEYVYNRIKKSKKFKSLLEFL